MTERTELSNWERMDKIRESKTMKEFCKATKLIDSIRAGKTRFVRIAQDLMVPAPPE